MSVPNPAQVRQVVMNTKFNAQAEQIAANGLRRARARAKGLRGPMTRAELAAMALERSKSPR